MPSVILPAHVHRRLIDDYTSPTDRLIYADRGERLADGSLRWEMPDDVAALLREFMLEGESYTDAIERLLAEISGQIS
jgi:hypothetical protein